MSDELAEWERDWAEDRASAAAAASEELAEWTRHCEESEELAEWERHFSEDQETAENVRLEEAWEAQYLDAGFQS